MSKIAFTVSVPHEGPHIPQLSVSCNNATFLSFKGKDINKARWGNGNIVSKKGWKRLEFGVIGSHAATKFTVILNTSAILPPVAWSTPGPAPVASTVPGGGSASRKDLRNERRLLKETEGKERLRLEDGRRDTDQDERDRFREGKSKRGERVRRSERRRQQEEGMSPLGESEGITGPADHYSRTQERTRMKGRGDRQGSHGERSYEGFWDDESKQRSTYHDDHGDYHARRRRRPSSVSEASVSGRRVPGKKIPSKYRNPNRTSEGGDWQDVVGGADRSGHGIAKPNRYDDHKPSYRRSQRRGRVDPVDLGYQPDVDDGVVIPD